MEENNKILFLILVQIEEDNNFRQRGKWCLKDCELQMPYFKDNNWAFQSLYSP